MQVKHHELRLKKAATIEGVNMNEPLHDSGKYNWTRLNAPYQAGNMFMWTRATCLHVEKFRFMSNFVERERPQSIVPKCRTDTHRTQNFQATIVVVGTKPQNGRMA
jgi:hypothetical protein